MAVHNGVLKVVDASTSSESTGEIRRVVLAKRAYFPMVPIQTSTFDGPTVVVDFSVEGLVRPQNAVVGAALEGGGWGFSPSSSQYYQPHNEWTHPTGAGSWGQHELQDDDDAMALFD